MSKKKLPQPHDGLFRRSMEEIQIARDWFQANLLKELLSQGVVCALSGSVIG